MPALTVEQKAINHTRLRDRVPVKDIAAELRVSKNTVILCKKKTKEDGEIKRKPDSGRRKISTEDEHTELVNFLREQFLQDSLKRERGNQFPRIFQNSKTSTRRVRHKQPMCC